jgi:hypothetical protein
MVKITQNMSAKFYPSFMPINGYMVSAQPPAKTTAGLIEKETDVSYDLHDIRLRAQSVCICI